MGENFKPYLSIMIQKGIKNHYETIILFGAYLSKVDKDCTGYKKISKFSFENFIDELIALEKRKTPCGQQKVFNTVLFIIMVHLHNII
jgi:hypothetical protein